MIEMEAETNFFLCATKDEGAACFNFCNNRGSKIWVDCIRLIPTKAKDNSPIRTVPSSRESKRTMAISVNAVDTVKAARFFQGSEKLMAGAHRADGVGTRRTYANLIKF